MILILFVNITSYYPTPKLIYCSYIYHWWGPPEFQRQAFLVSQFPTWCPHQKIRYIWSNNIPPSRFYWTYALLLSHNSWICDPSGQQFPLWIGATAPLLIGAFLGMACFSSNSRQIDCLPIPIDSFMGQASSPCNRLYINSDAEAAYYFPYVVLKTTMAWSDVRMSLEPEHNYFTITFQSNHFFSLASSVCPTSILLLLLSIFLTSSVHS